MRAVVQRVTRAAVTVEGRVTGRIGHGLLVFAGVAADDGPAHVAYVAGKLRDLRVFPDDHGRMNRSAVESGGAVLVVSQFTLHADCRKGRRPSFDAAAPAPLAEALYRDLIRALKESGLTVETGEFQAHMEVELLNDGPVTMLLDSRRLF